MNESQPVIVGLGELLWDLLPDGPQLGGAPANFAYYSALLGNRGVIASRVGADALGRTALRRLQELGVMTSHVQDDRSRPTGTVQVLLDRLGQPDFTITTDVAWDGLEWTREWQELATQTDAVCFGTLAQRSAQSGDTIGRFLQATRRETLRVFDVNLRQSFYSAEVLARSLAAAQVVKLNEAELPRVLAALRLGAGGDESGARRLLQAYSLELVCVTRGARGSLLVTGGATIEHPGTPTTVADTIGSGDAFTAALAHYYLRRAPLEEVSAAANRLGAWVASQTGAMPLVEPHTLRQIVGGSHESQ